MVFSKTRAFIKLVKLSRLQNSSHFPKLVPLVWTAMLKFSITTFSHFRIALRSCYSIKNMLINYCYLEVCNYWRKKTLFLRKCKFRTNNKCTHSFIACVVFLENKKPLWICSIKTPPYLFLSCLALMSVILYQTHRVTWSWACLANKRSERFALSNIYCSYI